MNIYNMLRSDVFISTYITLFCVSLHSLGVYVNVSVSVGHVWYLELCLDLQILLVNLKSLVDKELSSSIEQHQ